MALNYIWCGFFLTAFAVGLFRLVFLGDVDVFPNMVNSTFSMSKTAFEIALALTGVMTLWLGIMRVGEQGGMVNVIARLVGPFFQRLFPDLPKNHPVMGSIVMNFSANVLGLDNAATPLGLKAMQELQTLNSRKDEATNAQIMFLVLNTSGLTVIPLSIMVYRAEMGAANPSDVFLPILLATFFSTLAGLVGVALVQRISLFDKVILSYLGGAVIAVGSFVFYLMQLPQNQIAAVSSVVGNLMLFSVIILFVGMALWNKVNVYEAFVEGAKRGFGVAIRIIPYLVAMLVAIAVFRECGALDMILSMLRAASEMAGLRTDFIESLPTALMKPLSGSGARGMMVDTMQTYGADSFVGRLACTFQGSTETTFYVLAVYFGSVGIRRTRHAVACGLLADLAGILAAIGFGFLFFG